MKSIVFLQLTGEVKEHAQDRWIGYLGSEWNCLNVKVD